MQTQQAIRLLESLQEQEHISLSTLRKHCLTGSFADFLANKIPQLADLVWEDENEWDEIEWLANEGMLSDAKIRERIELFLNNLKEEAE